MSKGILGKKVGITQVYTDKGVLVPATVIEAGPCSVLAVADEAVRMGFHDKKPSRCSRPEMGNFKKAGSTPKAFVKEVRFSALSELKAGAEVNVDIFQKGEYVDISGITKGKGFQGGMKRWNWTAGKAGHGSMHHRRVGSIGASSFPSRVHRGKTMPGHLGAEKTTVQNLEILHVDKEQNLLVVKGTVPGHNDSYLTVMSAKKRSLSNQVR